MAKGTGRRLSRPMLAAGLGLGLLLAASWCESVAADALPAVANSTVVSLLTLVPGLVVLLACAWKAEGLEARCEDRRLIVAVGALAFAGRALRGLGLVVYPLAIVGVVVHAAAESFLFLLWLRFQVRHGARDANVVLPFGFLVAAAMVLVLSPLPDAAATALLPVLPVVSALLMGRALRLVAREAEADEEGGLPDAPDAPDASDAPGQEGLAGSWRFPYKPVVLRSVYAFAFYFSLTFTEGPSNFGPVGMLVVAALACGLPFAFKERYQPTLLYRLALPFMLAGLLVALFLDVPKNVSSFFTNGGNVLFELYLTIELVGTCYRFGVNPFWMFGLVTAAAKTFGVAGSLVGLMGAQAFGSGSVALSVLGALVVLVLVTCTFTLLDDNPFGGDFGLVPTPKGVDGAQSVVMSRYEQIAWKCGQAARRFGLTHREQEVLEFLVQGSTMAETAEQLYLSPGTVKTHTIHIYRKMGVHSREEMNEVVDAIR